MKKMGQTKYKEAHSANAKFGMGDYYGTGIRNPVGRAREVMGMSPISNKNLGKPPKSLA